MRQGSCAMNYWEQVKRRLARELPSEAYQNWVSHTVQEKLEGETLTVVVPNESSKDWMEVDYSDKVLSAIRELRMPFRQVVYVVAGESSLAEAIEAANVDISETDPNVSAAPGIQVS